MKSLKEGLQEKQLTISSLSTLLFNDVSLIDDDPVERDRAFYICTKMLDVAKELSIPSVSISPGKVLKDVSYEECLHRSIEQVKKIRKIAEANDTTLCVENVWQGLILSPIDFSFYCDAISSENFGACLDIGNASISTYAQHWIKQLQHRIAKVHITDLKIRRGTIYEFVDPSKGDTDWKRVMKELKDISYDGYLAIEAFAKKGISDKERLTGLSECLNNIMESK